MTSGTDDDITDNSTDVVQWIAHHILPDGADNVEATQRRNEELEAEAEQLRIRGEQLAARVEARENDDSGNEERDSEQ